MDLFRIIQSFVGTPHRKLEAMGNGISLLLGAATRYEASVEVTAGLETPRENEGVRRSAARKIASGSSVNNMRLAEFGNVVWIFARNHVFNACNVC